MEESKLLGSLMPSHPDLQPIIQEVRAKYQLPEINPDSEPITKIFLGDEIFPLEEFRLEIESLVIASEKFLPEHLGKMYAWGKKFLTH